MPARADKWVIWTLQEAEILKQLIQSHASQIEIAAALPDRNWRAIRTKAYEIVGLRVFNISPKPIQEGETYPQYLKRVENTTGKLPVNRSHWVPEEMTLLEKLLDAGATQLEIAAALPYRSWQKIRKRITQLRGKAFKVPKAGQMEANETFMDYLHRNPDFLPTSTMSFLTEGNLAPR